MPPGRRSRSKERSKAAATKLRMDTKPQTPRITDPSLPAGRRREIDNVMKKARAAPDQYWDKKLLEVEAKDPNRWRHSGYKSLYIDGSSPSPSRNSRSPLPQAARMAGGRRSRSSSRRRSSSPHSRTRRRPRSPSRSPRRTRRSPSTPPSRRARGPRSPPLPSGPNRRPGRSPIARSASGSTVSSCSDDSCSVCSPKGHARRGGTRSRSYSPPHRSKPLTTSKSTTSKRPPSPTLPPRSGPRMPRPMTPPPPAKRIPKAVPSGGEKPTDPRRRPPPPPRPRPFAGEAMDVVPKPMPSRGATGGVKRKEKGSVQEPVLLTRIKKERTGPPVKGRTTSPGAESSGGASDSGGSATSLRSLGPIVATTRLTLSERFGKIAQWSADRERRGDNMENMRITKTGGDLKVMMMEQEERWRGGSRTPPRRYSLSPVPAGHYPEELLASGPSSRLAAWDDVRVRYQYYKELGYLRDLSLDDYVKWEEWWYKYQDWLANERHYEHWLREQRGTGRRGSRHAKRRESKRADN